MKYIKYCLICSLILISSCKKEELKEKKAEPEKSKTTVKWDKKDKKWEWVEFHQVKNGGNLPVLPVPGKAATLEKNVFSLSTPLKGRVETIAITVGQNVVKGQKIALIRSVDYTDLQKNVTMNQQEIKIKEKQLENAKVLEEAKSIAEKDVISIQQDYKESLLNLKNSQEKISAIDVERASEDSFWLKAGRSGTVTDVNISVGQEVSPDSPSFINISNLSTMLVMAQVFELDTQNIKAGDREKIYMPGRQDLSVEGIVQSINKAIDPEQRTVTVRIIVENAPQWLRPNAYVQVLLNKSLGGKIIVPTEAVVSDDLNSVVFVKQKDGSLKTKNVIVGKQTIDKTEIISGLSVGDTIVSKGAILLLNEVQS